MYYFAYGSNMNIDQMAERMKLTGWDKVSKVQLCNHRLALTVWSRSQQAGFADVVPSEGDSVWGVLYKIDHMREMDLYEGHRYLTPHKSHYIRLDYEPRHFHQNYLGANDRVCVYRVRAPWTKYDLPWSQKYRSTVISGAIDAMLPAWYIAYLRNLPTQWLEELSPSQRRFHNWRAKILQKIKTHKTIDGAVD